MTATLGNFTIDTFSVDSNVLTWSFTQVPIETVDLEIYVSETPSNDLTEYAKLTTLTINDATYTDTSVSGLNDPSRIWYYKIKLADQLDDANFLIFPDNPAYGKDTPIDYAALRILELKKLSLERFTQRTMYLLKRRTWGTHCSVCWDETLQRCTDPNCTTCDGTGWETGYFNPLRFQCMVTASPTHNQVLQFGVWKPGAILLTTLNFPMLLPRDVVVDDFGIRWVVVESRPTEKLGRTIEQQVQLSRLQPDDISYKLTVVQNPYTGLLL